MTTMTLPRTNERTVVIDFLFLDLTTCTRCVGTNENLETALQKVSDLLTLTNREVMVNKILIESETQAAAHQFVTSPTIRINGRDIALEMRESQCDSCTDLCGCEEGTQCREWVYQGEVYMEAPVQMIVEALLQEVYRGDTLPSSTPVMAGVSDNLKNFFAGKEAQMVATDESCCSEATQQSCCEPAAKADCCGETAVTGSCGCQ